MSTKKKNQDQESMRDQTEFSEDFLRTLGKRPSWQIALYATAIGFVCVVAIGALLYGSHLLIESIKSSWVK